MRSGRCSATDPPDQSGTLHVESVGDEPGDALSSDSEAEGLGRSSVAVVSASRRLSAQSAFGTHVMRDAESMSVGLSVKGWSLSCRAGGERRIRSGGRWGGGSLGGEGRLGTSTGVWIAGSPLSMLCNIMITAYHKMDSQWYAVGSRANNRGEG